MEGDYKEGRRDKVNYYLDIAEAVASRSTCLRKKYGSVIVNHDEIVSTGYNGAPRGRENCMDLGRCVKKEIFPDVRHGGFDACRAVHSEQNALISASRKEMLGATLYLVGKFYQTGELVSDASSCALCNRMIINAGIEKVIIRNDKDNYTVVEVSDWIENDDSLSGTFGY